MIEEIVGNIFDEDDDEEKLIEKIDDNTFIINGSTSLDEVQETLSANLPVDDYETLSGFIIGQLGIIPENGDKPTIEFDELVFKVEAIEEKKVLKVKVCRAL